jgi:hypothetical protein
MTTDEAHQRVHEDPIFVYMKRFGYEIDRLMQRYPEGCPDHVIAAALMITEDDVSDIYDSIVATLQNRIGVDTT